MNPQIAHYAVLAGLCALVPIPLLDAWLERRATRAMLRALGAEAGCPLDEPTLDLLTEDRSSVLFGCLTVVVVWPLKKFFRTVLYFLTVKDLVDGTARAAIRAAMVHAALPRLPAAAVQVREAMDATLGRYDYSPIFRTLVRGKRPATTWVAAGHSGRLVGWLYEKGGGAVIRADFERRLSEIQP